MAQDFRVGEANSDFAREERNKEQLLQGVVMVVAHQTISVELH